MRDIGIRLVVDDSQKTKLQGFATSANKAFDDVQARWGNPFAQYDYALNRVGASLASLGRSAFTTVGAGVAGLTVAMGGLSRSLFEVNERFTNLQISMGSALRSMSAAKGVVAEVMKYTARSSLPYEAIANAANVMAASPQMSGLLQKQINSGQLGNQNGTMQRYLDLINAMQVYRPDRTPDQAVFAVRSFMGGNTRSMNRVYNMSPDSIAAQAQVSKTEMKNDPEVRLNAIEKVFNNIIDRQALVAQARQPKALAQNFIEQGIDIPMKMLGEGRPNSPSQPYNQILIRFQRIYDDLAEFVSKSFEEKFAPRLREAITTTFDKLFSSAESIFTKALDAMGISGSGISFERAFEGITFGIEKITTFITDIAKTVDEHDMLGTLTKFIATITKIVGAITKFFLVDLEGTLKKFTGVGGLGFASLAIAPAVLANLGSAIRFFEAVPGFFSKVSKSLALLRWGNPDAAITAGDFRGSSVLRANARGSNPYDQPVWSAGGSIRGVPAALYREGFDNNSVMSGRMNELLAPIKDPAKQRRAYLEYTRAQLKADTAYINDPKNAGVIQQLRDKGMGGNSLIGIANAAEEERKRKLDPIPVGQRIKNVGATALGAVTSVAGGIAITAGVSLLLAGIGTGLNIVYKALTDNSNTIRENTLARSQEQKDFVASIVNSPELKKTAQILGTTPDKFITDKNTAQRNDMQVFINEFLPKAKSAAGSLGEIGPTKMQKFMTSLISFAASGVDYRPDHNPANSMTEDQKKLVDETLKASGMSDLPKLVNALTALPATIGVSFDGVLKTWDSGDHLSAAKSLISILDKVPGGMSTIATQMAEVQLKLNQMPFTVAREMVTKQYGKDFGGIINMASSGALNPANEDEVMSKILGFAGGGDAQQGFRGSRMPSIEGLRALTAQTAGLNNHPLAAKMSERLDADMEKMLPSKNTAEQLDSLFGDQQKMKEELRNVLMYFDADQKQTLTQLQKYVDAAPKDNELALTYRKILADPNKFGDLRRSLEDSVKSANDDGKILVTATMSVYSTISDLFKEGAKISDQALDDAGKNLGPVLAKMGMNFDLSSEGIGAIGANTVKTDKLGRRLTVEDKLAAALMSAKERISKVTNPSEDLLNIVKLIDHLMESISAQVETSMRLFKNSSLVDAIKQVDAQTKSAILETSAQARSAGEQVKILGGLTNSRSMSKSRFGQTMKASSTSAGGALTEGMDKDLRSFISGLGYTESTDKQTALAALLPGTHGFDQQTALENNIKIQDKIRELYTVSPDSRNNTNNAIYEQQKLIDDKGTSPEQKIKAQEQILALAEAEAVLDDKSIEALRTKNMLMEQLLQLQVAQSKEGFMGGFTEGLHTAKEDLMDLLSAGREVGMGIKTSFTDAFTSLLQGTATAKEAFHGLVRSVADMLTKMMLQKAVSMFFNWAIGAFGGGFSSAASTGTTATSAGAGWGWGLGATGGVVTNHGIGNNPILHLARGGSVMGGSGTRDDVPAMLMDGEFVLNRRAAKSIGYPALNRMNSGGMAHFADGGMVGSNVPSMTGMTGRTVNITINIKNEGGKSSSEIDLSEQSEQMKVLGESINSLVEEKLLEHSRARGFFKSV